MRSLIPTITPPTPLALLTLLTLFITLSSCRKSQFIIEDVHTITDQGGGTGTNTWTRDKEYLLDGFIFVNDGQTLTIEEGTVIRARTGQGSLASALIVARGGTIIAEGNRTDPIIFTVEGDDFNFGVARSGNIETLKGLGRTRGFDVEIVFLYPWAVAFDLLPLFAVFEGVFFIIILAAGLIYAWQKGALEWS